MQMVNFKYKITVYNLFTVYTYTLDILLKTCFVFNYIYKIPYMKCYSPDRTAKSGTKVRGLGPCSVFSFSKFTFFFPLHMKAEICEHL